jgi:3-phosphoshikimate 1-carboxyvinyltransferase
MAAAIAATICTAPVRINGAQAVSKSYPDFFAHYAQLGGDVHVL